MSADLNKKCDFTIAYLPIFFSRSVSSADVKIITSSLYFQQTERGFLHCFSIQFMKVNSGKQK